MSFTLSSVCRSRTLLLQRRPLSFIPSVTSSSILSSKFHSISYHTSNNNRNKMETRASSSSSSSSDIISIIKGEHKLVDGLYKQFQSSNNNVQKQKLMHEIVKELSVHAACEEMVLYPAVLKYVKSKGEQLADHSIKEHREMKKDLYELDSMKITDPNCEIQLAKVMRDVTHHVGEEESDLLPALAGSVSAEELIKLGESFTNHKAIAPTRPHPSAVDEYPMNVPVNAGTKPLDSIRDAMRQNQDNKATEANLQEEKSKHTTTSA